MGGFKKAMKITGKVTLGIIAVLLIGGGIARLYFGRQLSASLSALKAAKEPLTFAELAGPPVPEKDNAAPLYMKAFKMKLPENCIELTQRLTDVKEYGPPSDKDWANAESALRQCSEYFKLIDEAQARPKFYRPIYQNVAWDTQADFSKYMSAQEEQFNFNAHLRDAARLYGAKAVIYAHKGDSRGMLSAIETSLKLGTVMDNRFLVDHLLEIAVLRISFARMRNAMGYCSLNQAQLEELGSALSKINPRKAHAKALRGERVLFLQEGQNLPKYYSFIPIYSLDVMMLADSMQKQIDNTKLSYPEAKSKGCFDDLTRENLPAYAIFSKIIVPVFARAQILNYNFEAEIACGRAALAIEAYKNKFGVYPGKLSEVGPIGKLQIPNDPFTGKPLIYRPLKNGYVIYSLGENQKDDGGLNEQKNVTAKGADDVCWKMERKI